MTLPGRAEVALGTNIETIMVTIMVLLDSQCNIISSTFSCQSSSYSVELGVDPDFYFPFVYEGQHRRKKINERHIKRSDQCNNNDSDDYDENDWRELSILFF